MLIANPIYDVVFKYLLDDNKVAKLFIGALLEAEIIELEIKPQEMPTTVQKTAGLNLQDSILQVLRLDFKATVRCRDGSLVLVLIELQKAKVDIDLMRFRRYLGIQYADPNNVSVTEGIKKPLPLISIYFLGYNLTNFKQSPILRIRKQYIDNFSKNVLLEQDPFVEALNHDSIVIQIPQIKHKRRDELEQILSIFEEGSKTIHDMKYEIPPKYEAIVKRLGSALSDEGLSHALLAEEELLYELNTRSKTMEEALEREREALEQKEVEMRLKEKEIAIKKTAMKNLKSKGLTTSEIAIVYNTTEAEINELLF